jgi:hypothetical protein
METDTTNFLPSLTVLNFFDVPPASAVGFPRKRVERPATEKRLPDLSSRFFH